jgi:hypothetical protein
MLQFYWNNSVDRADQAIRFSGDPQPERPEIPCRERLSDKILIEDLTGRDTRTSARAGAQSKENERQRDRRDTHQENCHFAHPSQQKTMSIAPRSNAANAASL